MYLSRERGLGEDHRDKPQRNKREFIGVAAEWGGGLCMTSELVKWGNQLSGPRLKVEVGGGG